MSDNTSNYPLWDLHDTLREWADGVREHDFWREGNNVDYVNHVDEIRSYAKALIVWMELRDLGEQASRLEVKMQEFREAVWNFQHECEYSTVYPPEDERCYIRRTDMAELAEAVAACAERLDDEIDPSIWEGFYDA